MMPGLVEMGHVPFPAMKIIPVPEVVDIMDGLRKQEDKQGEHGHKLPEEKEHVRKIRHFSH